MDISSYSNERILNTIKQSYNFDNEIVEFAKIETLKRDLLDSVEIEKILSINEDIRIIKRLKNEFSDASNNEKKTLLTKVLKRLTFIKNSKFEEDNAIRNYDISNKRRFKKNY